jgi:nucleoside 2-deoxyribosyltransferase
VLTYVHGCSFGVAVFERLLDDDFNPNVALEVGYMLALKKPVCLLKDKTMANLHTDLIGKLYRTFDPQDAFESVQPPLRAWASDKGLIVQGQYPSTNQPQTIKVNEDPRDVGRAANAVMSASPKLLQMPHN